MERVSTDTATLALALASSAHNTAVEAAEMCGPDLGRAADMIAAAFASGGQLLLCGNGGSAADAQHIAAEFVGRYLSERDPLPAIALSANTSAVTAIANDYGFAEVFARQVRAHGRAGDVLLAISTSGDSPNVIAAARAAKDGGLSVVGLAGRSGGELAGLCDVCMTIPVRATPRIQEAHMLLGHVLCGLVEDALK